MAVVGEKNWDLGSDWEKPESWPSNFKPQTPAIERPFVEMELPVTLGIYAIQAAKAGLSINGFKLPDMWWTRVVNICESKFIKDTIGVGASATHTVAKKSGNAGAAARWTNFAAK